MVTEKGRLYDPLTKDDAGGTPASKLLSKYRTGLHPCCSRVQRAFPSVARQAWSGTSSTVSGVPVPRPKTGGAYGCAVQRRAAFLLRQDPEPALHAREHPAAKGAVEATDCAESAGGDPTHRRGPQPDASCHSDDAVFHRYAG